jgi:phenylpropionate dioxygenase-like ring-hydroxylating dioxygenase large terminal subunit
MYVRNAWYVAGWAQELEEGRPAGFRILDEPIVIWRTSARDLVAFEDRCIHRLAPLSLGRCEGERLRCMYHGLLYDSVGRVVEIPGQNQISSGLRLKTYPVVERHRWIWVWMGDPAAADEHLIPQIVCREDLDRNDYVFVQGQLDVAAQARLVFDNLLDLSHISFLHSESLKLGEIWAQESPKVTQHERGIRSERWLTGEAAGRPPQTEEFFCADYFIPGVVLFTGRIYQAGSAYTLGGNAPDLNHRVQTAAAQAITPLTGKTARAFYMVAVQHCGEDAAFKTKIQDIQDKALAEDKTMIEAQQHNLDATPGFRFISTSADRGVILFNRLTEALSRLEKTM